MPPAAKNAAGPPAAASNGSDGSAFLLVNDMAAAEDAVETLVDTGHYTRAPDGHLLTK